MIGRLEGTCLTYDRDETLLPDEGQTSDDDTTAKLSLLLLLQVLLVKRL